MQISYNAADGLTTKTHSSVRRAASWAVEHRYHISAGLAVALMLTQVAVIRLSPSGMAVRVALPATIAAVPVALWPHRRRLGVTVALVGLTTNLAVILANGGLMPIERTSVVSAIGPTRAGRYAPGSWMSGSKDVLVEDGQGRAAVLGDSIVVHLGPGGLVASPGDVVIVAGLLLIAAEAGIIRLRRGRAIAAQDARSGRPVGGAAAPR